MRAIIATVSTSIDRSAPWPVTIPAHRSPPADRHNGTGPHSMRSVAALLRCIAAANSFHHPQSMGRLVPPGCWKGPGIQGPGHDQQWVLRTRSAKTGRRAPRSMKNSPTAVSSRQPPAVPVRRGFRRRLCRRPGGRVAQRRAPDADRWVAGCSIEDFGPIRKNALRGCRWAVERVAAAVRSQLDAGCGRLPSLRARRTPATRRLRHRQSDHATAGVRICRCRRIVCPVHPFAGGSAHRGPDRSANPSTCWA